MPVRVQARRYPGNARPIELDDDLFGGIDEQIGSVHEDRRPEPGVLRTVRPCLRARLTLAERFRRRDRSTRAEYFQTHRPSSIGAPKPFDGAPAALPVADCVGSRPHAY